MTTLLPGSLVGGNRIVCLLGTGTVAEVYDVVAQDGARRALKILTAEASQAAKLKDRAVKEAEAVGVIDHPNVVGLYDTGVEGDRMWMLLDRVDGPDLGRLVREGGVLDVARAVRIVRQAAEGVAAAHALGILHRDLKPENILVGPGDLVKVTDFGHVYIRYLGAETTGQAEPGQALHMAPEYLQNRAEPRSDVYSLAIILFEVIAGVHPLGLAGA
jgi:serine/threonine-protein kinase